MDGTTTLAGLASVFARRAAVGFARRSGRGIAFPGGVAFAVGDQLPSGRIAGSRTVLPASYVAGARAVSPDDLYRLVYGDLSHTSPRAYGGASAARLGAADRCYYPTSRRASADRGSDAA